MPRRIQVEEGSGNVFADIGLPNPEEAMAKAEIARQVNRILAERGLNQVQAGALLRIAQPCRAYCAGGGSSEDCATARVRSGTRPVGKILAGKTTAVCPAGGNRC